jgi:hypothetical protein
MHGTVQRSAWRKEDDMRGWHIGVCIGLMAVGLVLVMVGAGVFAFLAPLGCVAMMAMMFWMMAPSSLKTKARGFAGRFGGHHAAGH